MMAIDWLSEEKQAGMGVCSWKWFHREEKASETWNKLAKDRQLKDAMHRREPNTLNRGDLSTNKSSIELIQWMIAQSIYCSVHKSQASNDDWFYWKTTRLGPFIDETIPRTEMRSLITSPWNERTHRLVAQTERKRKDFDWVMIDLGDLRSAVERNQVGEWVFDGVS